MSDDLDPYWRLSTLLSLMQMELGGRYWPEEKSELVDRAAEFRMKLFKAVCDYRDWWIDASRP